MEDFFNQILDKYPGATIRMTGQFIDVVLVKEPGLDVFHPLGFWHKNGIQIKSLETFKDGRCEMTCQIAFIRSDSAYGCGFGSA